jgi:transcriptional regulator with XRE-family HTH domain
VNWPTLDFGHELDALRRKRGLSWARLAAEANVAQSYLVEISHGRRGWPSQPIVDAVAAALDVDPDYFTLTRARAVLESPKAIEAGYKVARREAEAA